MWLSELFFHPKEGLVRFLLSQQMQENYTRYIIKTKIRLIPEEKMMGQEARE